MSSLELDQAARTKIGRGLLVAVQKRNERAEAIAALKQVRNLLPLDLDLTNDLATAARLLGELDDAESLSKDVLSRRSGDVAALLRLGHISAARQEHPMAIDWFRKALAVRPTNEYGKYFCAKSLRAIGKCDEAQALLSEILPTDHQYAASRKELISITVERGDVDATARALSEARHAGVAIHELVRLLTDAMAERDMSRVDLLLQAMKQVEFEHVELFLVEGRRHRSRLDHHSAIASFRRAAEVSPDAAAPLVELATEHFAIGQGASAGSYLLASLEREPNNLHVLSRLADQYQVIGDDEKALDMARRARMAHPAKPHGYMAEAQTLAAQGNLDQALQALAEARISCGAQTQLAVAEAQLLGRVGRVDEGFRVLRAAHPFGDADQAFWGRYTNMLIAEGEFDEARARIDDRQPKTPFEAARVLSARAKLSDAQWNFDDAIAHLLTAIEQDHALAGAQMEIARLYLLSFDLKNARRYLELNIRHNRARLHAAQSSQRFKQSQLGQVYAEFEIDRDLIDQLAIVNAGPAIERIGKFAEIVRGNPESTAAAIALLIGLRRAGLFPTSTAGQAPGSPIPRAIHQYWDAESVPADVGDLMKSWVDRNPGYSHTVFNAKTARAYLEQHCNGPILQAFLRTRERTQQADLFRLALLYREGGTYVDADDRCRASIAAVLAPNSTLVCFQEEYGSIGNNFVAVVPGHPAIGSALAAVCQALLRGDRDIARLSTGPGALSRAIAGWLAAQDASMLEVLSQTSILDRHEVRRVLAPYCQAAYKRTALHWRNAAFGQRSAAQR